MSGACAAMPTLRRDRCGHTILELVLGVLLLLFFLLLLLGLLLSLLLLSGLFVLLHLGGLILSLLLLVGLGSGLVGLCNDYGQHHPELRELAASSAFYKAYIAQLEWRGSYNFLSRGSRGVAAERRVALGRLMGVGMFGLGCAPWRSGVDKVGDGIPETHCDVGSDKVKGVGFKVRKADWADEGIEQCR